MKLLNVKMLLAFAALIVIGTGCLKDKDYDDGRIGINIDKSLKFVEIAGPSSGFMNVDLVGSPTDTSVDLVLVRLASDAPADKDIQVTLALDPGLVTAYNADHGTNYTVPTASQYTLPSLTVTIPRGERQASLRLTAKPNNLFGGEYALGLRIASVSDASVKISGNWNAQVVGLTIRNKYDGIYTVVSGTVTRYSNPTTVENPSTLNGPLAGNPDVTMTTAGANTVVITGLQWRAGSNSGVGGIDGLRATVDPATNLVTMTATGNATLANWAGKENRYDPATKTFYLAFRWNPVTTPREYEVVLKYKSPR
ncbi:MAG: DUF1735 domain-containing protein [Chitinophagaceae bacterium]